MKLLQTRRTRFVALAVGIGGVAISCLHAPHREVVARDVAAETLESREAAFARLEAPRRERNRVTELAGPQPAGFDFGQCPRALSGASRSEVLKRLGPPDRGPTSSPSADVRMTYHFYYLPRGWVGGGRELELILDTSGTVTQVRCPRSE